MDFAKSREKSSRDTSLSESLRRQLLISPFLNWDNEKRATLKILGKPKGLDHNLFHSEGSTRNTQRVGKETKGDPSDVHENLFQRNVNLGDSNNMGNPKAGNLEMVNHRFPIKKEEFYQKTLEPLAMNYSSIQSSCTEPNLSGRKSSMESHNQSLKLITFNTWSKEHSIFGTQYTNPLKSIEMSRGSHNRLGSLSQSDNHSRSLASLNHEMDIASSTPIRKATRLSRQYSDIELAKNSISLSTASFKTTATTEGNIHDVMPKQPSSINGTTESAFLGFNHSYHSQTVAATLFNRKHREHISTSSSSSDGVMQSTRHAREILEERFCGNLLKKTEQETGKPTTAMDFKLKRNFPKSSRKVHCRCRAYHKTCARRSPNKIKSPGAERKNVEVCEIKRSTILSPENERNAPKDLLAQRRSESFEKLHPCRLETCPTGKVDSPRKPVQTKAKTLDLGIAGSKDWSSRTESAACLKVEEPNDDVCDPQTCLFSKNRKPCENPERNEHWRRSSRTGLHRKPKRLICSYKLCKVPLGFSNIRFGQLKARRGNPRRNTSRPRYKPSGSSKRRGDKQFICDCQGKFYTGEKESGSDNLWKDADNIRAQRPRRYKLNEKNKTVHCNAVDEDDCCCYNCKSTKKPLTKHITRRNKLIDVPYLLTQSTLSERGKRTSEMKKTLTDAFSWTEDDLKNFCTKSYSCKKPNTRKTLLRDNPYRMRVCKKKDTPTEPRKPTQFAQRDVEELGRFGYFVDIIDERLAIDEPRDNLQILAERAVYCKWHRDIADMKVDHFKENTPKHQDCYSNPTLVDLERRTCYNPKLIERLADMVQFNMKPDRRLHEFSFFPKLLKYEEPRLIGDTHTDMPEIKVLKYPGPLPTLYGDIFKVDKHNLRKLMDHLLPPLQWTDNMGLWEMKVSLQPDNAENVKQMISFLEENESLCQAINGKFCAGRYRLCFEAFAEAIRQELLEYPERAFLLSRIRDEFFLTILLYEGGLNMTLTSATHTWKPDKAEAAKNSQMEFLEEEIGELRSQISEIRTLTYQLEKRAEELADSKSYLHEDDIKMYKKIIHQFNAQIEAIKAGFLYDID